MSRSAGSILVGVDGSASSDQALAWAAEQAAAERKPLTLLHALPRTTPSWLAKGANELRLVHELSLRDMGQDVLDRARQDVRRMAPGVNVRGLFRLEDPREALIELSATASMLVLGSRGRGHVKSLLLGSTAVAAVRHARCPVIVHHPADFSPLRAGIAVGADAGADSLPVLEFAFRQASARNLPLTVVHSFWYFRQPQSVEEVHADPFTAAQQQQLALAESLAGFAGDYPDVRVQAKIDEGMPERCLLRLADKMQLLVVGSHHVSRSQQLMFDSVSVWLVEHAGCPVAVVPLSVNQTLPSHQRGLYPGGPAL